ncbi:hypothetical protein DTO021D3_9208 [Paecilomyces variotii]|nr:hypothetical protein DTO032I3_4216 [Paecilomyces variotii]KAJ9273923.1 hypothetical protein DTO021D3_9208 [Paecilomyces variotii]KAJ9347062.1 hypothetical protein DTO027B6_629 [Paecilomyces variotii]KAJ9347456.1 hypothetical protein DTO027B9_9190 [Paecilomyces variotii]KAJ9393357.1 hypothetical protein DTO032I4_128 [Paecilomyces variotii]
MHYHHCIKSRFHPTTLRTLVQPCKVQMSTKTTTVTPGSSAHDWSATQYLKFAAQRNRPVRDLVAQIPLSSPRKIVDLGCGPGNSTQALIERYPSAQIHGLDNSPDMLSKARANVPHIDFSSADLSVWTPGPDDELLFSNAVFHWLPDSVGHMARMLNAARPGAVLAVQVPDNYLEPSHVAMRETAAAGPWKEILEPLKPALDPMPSPREIYNRLHAICTPGGLDVWHTFYSHVLDGPEQIVEWVKGSGLRPFIDPLEKGLREEFLQKYTEMIAEVYPRLEDGKVLLRYPRLFIIAQRK